MTTQLIRWKPQNKRQKSSISENGIWWKVLERKSDLVLIEPSNRKDLRWIQRNQIIESVEPDAEWLRVFNND